MVTQQMIDNLQNKANALYVSGRFTLSIQYDQAALLLEHQRDWEEARELAEIADWLDEQQTRKSLLNDMHPF
jgi:hypothetical protein